MHKVIVITTIINTRIAVDRIAQPSNVQRVKYSKLEYRIAFLSGRVFFLLFDVEQFYLCLILTNLLLNRRPENNNEALIGPV